MPHSRARCCTARGPLPGSIGSAGLRCAGFLVTDTIAMDENVKLCPKIRVLSVAPLIAAAIRRVHEGQSVSYLFEHVPDHAKVKP